VRRATVLAAALALAALAASSPARAGDTAAMADTSADGRWIAEVRDTPDSLVESASGSVPRTRLVLVESAGGNARTLVAGGVRKLRNGGLVAGMSSPAFSPDGKRVYFLSAGWVTSDALCSVDVAGGAMREHGGANALDMVRRGRYAGDMIVEQHRYHAAGGAYDWLYLVDPAGRTLRTLGDPDDARVQARVRAILAGRAK
jgi:hypothetical protein